jgi:uroporphyrinogen decarboxylase
MERLLAAVEGRTSDRIPVFCNLLEQGARELGVPLREYYASGEMVAEAQLRMREHYGYDNVGSLFYVGKEAELLGSREILFADDGPPNVQDFVIKEYDDVFRLHIPDAISDHPAFEEIRTCLEILRQNVGGKYPICAHLTASMTLPALLMGMERWIELLLTGPVSVRDELLTRCSEFFRRQIQTFRDAGADVLFYSNPFGSTDFLSRCQFRDLVLPWMERDLSPGGTEGVVYYCGSARFNQVIDDVIRRIGIPTYYLSPLDDVAEGKRIIAGRGLTCGTINDIMLVDWSPEQIRHAVRRIIQAGKPGGRFLFGTILMPSSIPELNIRAMLDAAYEFGRYQV